MGRCAAVSSFAVLAACSSASGPGETPASYLSSSSGGGSSGTNADAGSPSGSTPGATSAGDDSGASTGTVAADAAQAAPEAGDDGTGAGDDGSAPVSADAATSCVKGQVQPNEVVMLGDSYLDPAWGNIGPTLMTEANAMYRHYYIGGASLAWGNPNTQFYIPYQYDPMALTDITVMNPSDIKIVIMDGGGNDVLIGNTSCETTAPPMNASCVTTVQNAINEGQAKMQEMAQKGVQSVVFFFYPHLNPAGGGILLTPAPAVNETLDYAYPFVEQLCCGASFTSDLTHYSCSGQPAPGLNCVFIDTRPSFEGHISDYIKSDNVHPTQAGAQVIANLIWAQMQDHCIAQ